MTREIVTLKGFDDTSLGGRVRKGAFFEVSQQLGDQLVRNGLAAFTSDLHVPPPPVGNESAAGTAAPSSASPAAPLSPSTALTTSSAFAPGDSAVSKPKRARKPRAMKTPPPVDESSA